MIVELTSNKYVKRKPNDKHILHTLAFFQVNRNVWYKKEELVNVIGYTDMRRIINELRNMGVPIVSSRNGYKYTTNKDEIKKCYDDLRLRALRALTAANKLKKNMK